MIELQTDGGIAVPAAAGHPRGVAPEEIGRQTLGTVITVDDFIRGGAVMHDGQKLARVTQLDFQIELVEFR